MGYRERERVEVGEASVFPRSIVVTLGLTVCSHSNHNRIQSFVCCLSQFLLQIPKADLGISH